MNSHENSNKKYRLEERMNQGAFGTVYRAQTPQGEYVAIKVPSGTRLNHEATVLKAVHAHGPVAGVPAYVDQVVLSNGKRKTRCLVMEYMPGVPLSSLAPHTLSLCALIQAITRVLITMEHIHRCKVVHKDLTLNNVLFDAETARIAIVDFGLAQINPRFDAYHFEAVEVLLLVRTLWLLYGDATTYEANNAVICWFDRWLNYTRSRTAFLWVDNLLHEWQELAVTLAGVDAKWLALSSMPQGGEEK